MFEKYKPVYREDYTKWIKTQKDEIAKIAKDPKRLTYHLMPEKGWLNDPNGLCQFKGIYHIYYQYDPFDINGDLKLWAHVTTKDFIHYEQKEPFLFPDSDIDTHGAYSGSAFVKDNQIHYFYTGNIKLFDHDDYDYIHSGRVANTIHLVSDDGEHFDQKQLVMEMKDYPKEFTQHVRDPKLIEEKGIYYMVQGARTKEDKGVVLVFSSEDKYHWNYIHRLESEEKFGFMWECPDLYELDGQTILCISPQGVEQDGYWYANKYQTVTSVIHGDFRTDGVPEGFRELDGGFDFYAPQTFLTEDGRRILIGWMGMADVEDEYTNRTIEDGWQNVLTLARELSLKDGIVCQNPVRELSSWWNEEVSFEGQYTGNTDTCYELNLKNTEKKWEVLIAGGLKLSWSPEEYVFRMEFTDGKLGCGRGLRAREIKVCKDIRIVVDVSCVEVFMNGGKDVFSTRFYPEKDQYTVKASGDGLTGSYRYRV